MREREEEEKEVNSRDKARKKLKNKPGITVGKNKEKTFVSRSKSDGSFPFRCSFSPGRLARVVDARRGACDQCWGKANQNIHTKMEDPR